MKNSGSKVSVLGRGSMKHVYELPFQVLPVRI